MLHLASSTLGNIERNRPELGVAFDDSIPLRSKMRTEVWKIFASLPARELACRFVQ